MHQETPFRAEFPSAICRKPLITKQYLHESNRDFEIVFNKCHSIVVQAENEREDADQDVLVGGVGRRWRGRHGRGRGALPARHGQNKTSVGRGVLQVRT